MFTATLNRSLTSYIKAIIGAEYILRWLPIGTHDWNKFLKPEELESYLAKEKLTTKDVSGLKINYVNTSPEKLEDFETYDVILNLEIVEHVDNVDLYIKSCQKLLKKNGLMFTATLNRSLTSYIKAIIGAEYILRWLPIGTHDWNKFLKPEELENYLTKEKLITQEISGLKFNPFTKRWKKSSDLSVNYIICSVKN